MNDTSKIPFLDLVTPHVELEDELVVAFRSALKSAAFVGGPVLEKFERDFAAFCGTEHCVGVSSGTDALRFALLAAGIGTGDSVLTAPNTFIATTEAISQAGAVPEFVDIDPETYNLDPAMLDEFLETQCRPDPITGKLVSRRTGSMVSAVIPVHLYGQTADMDPIQELAAKFNLIVIEDACQAHGAEYFSRKDQRWKKAGSMGTAAAFSFYPGKNLGACGEAGAITTNDADLARRVRMLRDHGQSRKYYHDLEGYNGRLDAIQAGFLDVKLPHVAGWNELRRQAAARYNALLRDLAPAVKIPVEPFWAKAVYHLYVVQVEDRDSLIKHLGDTGIGTGIHYPFPLHLQKAYAGLGYSKGDFPITEAATARILSLPMFPQLHAEQQQRVVSQLQQFLERSLVERVA